MTSVTLSLWIFVRVRNGILSPLRGWARFGVPTHSLRCGLHSLAAPRLGRRCSKASA